MDTAAERGRYDVQPKERGEEEMARLGSAARLILAQMDYDELRRSLLDHLHSTNNGQYHCSETHRLHRLPQSCVSIPQSIADEYDRLECKSFVGLLPEINRAYITVDNKLFLWNYSDVNKEGGEFMVYTDLTQIIVSVGLVKPKPGVFPKQIKYLLVLATPVEVVLVGLRFLNDDVRQALTVYSTQFQVPTDNVNMLKIVGTNNGRIFMCGKDGNVYELAYQAEDGLFRKKCRKLNHSSSAFSMLLPSFLISGAADDPIVSVLVDSSRQPQLLYTLSQRNAIQVWSLGANGEEMVKLCTLNTVLKEALAQLHREEAPGLTPREFKIVSMAVITRTEAEQTCLVAVTQHSHRIFFTLDPPGWGKGYTLRVRFVRLSPPAITAQDCKQKKEDPGYRPGSSPKFVRAAFSRDGVTLFADVRPAAAGTIPEGDTLIALIPEAQGGAGAGLHEAVESVPLNARVADITEVDQEAYLTETARCLYARGQTTPLVGLSEFATQHAMPPRQFLVLTGKGLEVFSKSRPVDELRKALAQKKRSGDETELQSFFTTYGPKEACAMCLIIACAPSETPLLMAPSDAPVTPAPAHGFGNALRSPAERKYGGSAHRTPLPERKRPLTSVLSPYADVPGLGDASLAQLAIHAFFRYGEVVPTEAKAPGMPMRGGYQGGMAARAPTSGKLDGLAVYAQRLLRPVWDWTITFRKPNSEYNEMRYSTQQLITLRAPLISLKRFMDQNVVRFLRDPLRTAALHASAGTQTHQTIQEAQQNERESFEGLRFLLATCIEAMSFLIILSTQNFPRIFSRLDSSEQERLRTATFFELVTSAEGEAIVRFLIASMLALSTDSKAVIDELHRECPTFFAKADVLHYRAVDCLQKSRARFDDRKQRDDYQREALEYYLQSTRCRDFPLGDIAAYFREVHFYEGVVELALDRIRAVERGDVAITPAQPLFAQGIPGYGGAAEHDPEGAFILEERTRCYDAVITSLEAGFAGRYRNPAEEKVALEIPAAERRQLAERALHRCLSSEDEGFHIAVYRWMLQQDELRPILMQIGTPYLVPFLESDPQYIRHLLEYYSRNRMYKKAALMYTGLAGKKGREYSLDERTGFLQSALRNATAALEAGDEEDDIGFDSSFLTDLEDKKTVAEIQKGIRDRLKLNMPAEGPSELSAILDEFETELFDINTLYNLAQRQRLWDWCLRIVHFSEEYGQTELIKRLWTNLLADAIEQARSRGEPWPNAVRGQVVDIARYLTPATELAGAAAPPHPAVFPVDFVLWELEGITYKLGGYLAGPESKADSASWVVETLREAGVTPEALLEAYSRLIDRPPAELDDARRLQIVSSVRYLLERDLGRSQMRFYGSRPAFNIGYSLADQCLTELGTMNPVDRQLSYEKESLQAALRQIRQGIDQTLSR